MYSRVNVAAEGSRGPRLSLRVNMQEPVNVQGPVNVKKSANVQEPVDVRNQRTSGTSECTGTSEHKKHSCLPPTELTAVTSRRAVNLVLSKYFHDDRK